MARSWDGGSCVENRNQYARKAGVKWSAWLTDYVGLEENRPRPLGLSGVCAECGIVGEVLHDVGIEIDRQALFFWGFFIGGLTFRYRRRDRARLGGRPGEV